MQTPLPILLGAALLTCAVATAAETPKPMAFKADAKIEVGPDGKLVKVEASEDLPEGVRRYIEQQVATWTFRRKQREGQMGNATTYLSLGACAVPTTEGGYSMGLAFHWAGPRVVGGNGGWSVTRDVMRVVGKKKIDGKANARFVVRADGSAELEAFEGLDGRARDALAPAIEDWIEGLRFDPETIGGQAVATRATLPLEFRTTYDGPRTQDEARVQAMMSPECRQAGMAAAMGGGMKPVAVDSVIDVVPAI